MIPFLVTVPWAELFPIRELLVVSVLSPAISFWYGYRHPEGY